MDRHVPGKHRFPLAPDKPALHRGQQQRCALGRETPLQRHRHGLKRSKPSWAALSPLDTPFGWLQVTLTQRSLPITASTRTEQPPKPSADTLSHALLCAAEQQRRLRSRLRGHCTRGPSERTRQ